MRLDSPCVLATLVASLAAAGCGVADFSITQPVPERRISGAPIPGPLAQLFPFPLDLDISQQIQAMHTGPIKSVTLTSLELSITPTAQPEGDWSFVDEVDVYVSSSKSGSSLPKVKIAHVTAPGAVRVMDFTIEPDVDLEPYIDEGSTVEGDSSGRAPDHDVTYDGKGVFTVHPL